MSKEVQIVDVPLHKLMAHSRQVRENINAELLDAEREDAKAKFGLIEDETNGKQAAVQNRKSAGKSNGGKRGSKPTGDETLAGDGTQTASTDGALGTKPGSEADAPPVDEVNGEQEEENDGGDGADDGTKNPWD